MTNSKSDFLTVNVRENLLHFIYNSYEDKILELHFKSSELFQFEIKPKLSFEYTRLFYITHPAEQVFRYSHSDELIDMTEEQKQEVERYIDDFIEKEIDYMVAVYDPLYQNIWIDNMFSKEADKINAVYTNNIPEFINSKYNEETNSWEKIYAVVYETGAYQIDILNICDSCVLFYTFEEWKEVGPPVVNERYENYIWNFKENKWVDKVTKNDLIERYAYLLKDKIFSEIQSMKYKLFGSMDDLLLAILFSDQLVIKENEKFYEYKDFAMNKYDYLKTKLDEIEKIEDKNELINHIENFK